MGEVTGESLDVAADIAELDNKTAVTVEDLNSAISDVLADTDDLYFDYVVGDVSDYRDVNGNVHFDLDHGEASIHCVLLEFRREWVTDAFDDGTQVAVAGDLSYYEEEGSCSVFVTDVLELGEGTYQQIYEENRTTLAADGLLDDEHKQSLPEYPSTLGLITSINSDAREDAVTSVRARHPDVDIVIQHTRVQGDDAMASMMSAISELDRDPAVDLIILTRGGGADTTLRVFNETPLCRVIFNTDTPIVVGIGHEQDRTLAEEVADKRVMTPTHAGEVVPEKQALLDKHEKFREALDVAYRQTATTRLRTTADAVTEAYRTHATTVISDAETALHHAVETISSERLTALDNQLDHALETIHQQKKHEDKKEQAVAAAVEQTKDDLKDRAEQEVQTEYEAIQRRQRAAIVVLLVLLLLIGAYLIL